ncbi:MAG: response regulator [Rhodanobacteraceae bacterium]|nr:MAG: response regulator [Rhodanobacteraceae bacterium]
MAVRRREGMDKEEAGQFRVLLAEDDAVSRTFLCEAIRACGGVPTACEDGPSALALARTEAWHLLVLDHQLPGLAGDAVLAALRADPAAIARHAPAIATTAEPDAARVQLLRAGFTEVLPKPLSIATLRAVLERHGCRAGSLDDDDALRACGSPAAVAHLRQLFADQELPKVQYEFDHLGEARHALLPTLHRLRASCGFCGAVALAQASEALHHALSSDADPERVDAALSDFAQALKETRATLHAKLNGG